jgi:hypothetical protein
MKFLISIALIIINILTVYKFLFNMFFKYIYNFNESLGCSITREIIFSFENI